jgi:hypothetical protein
MSSIPAPPVKVKMRNYAASHLLIESSDADPSAGQSAMKSAHVGYDPYEGVCRLHSDFGNLQIRMFRERE